MSRSSLNLRTHRLAGGKCQEQVHRFPVKHSSKGEGMAAKKLR